MTKFLAEAAALLLRKPHEMWELQQGIIDAAIACNSTPLHQPDASLLPITVLRQAIRVAGSSKMPEATIIAICSYVKGDAPVLVSVCRTDYALEACMIARFSTCTTRNKTAY